MMMSSSTLLQETEAYFHEHIPLTRAMGVKVESYDAAQFVITAPLEVNHNHLGTAFGGSLSAIATLAGYGMLWLLLEDRDIHIVIRNSSINYRHPVRDPIRAICRTPDAAVLAVFQERFRLLGKARLDLQVTIEHEGRVCVEFAGTYVAVR